MSISNLQQNIHNRQLPIYNLDMSNFNPEVFAKWLNKSFEDSNFKTFTALADSAKLQRSTVSALANAKPQTLTSKASQPKPETVIALAKALKQDVDKALLLAGHAPQNSYLPDGLNIMDFRGFDDEDIKDIVEYIKFKRTQKQSNDEASSNEYVIGGKMQF